jgi:hypothetical protein
MSSASRRATGTCLALLLTWWSVGAAGAPAATGASPGASPGSGTGDVQAEFDAAMEAIEQQRLRTARERLTSLLAANPSLSRARLELAKVHYLSRDYADARREAQQVLDDPDTPPTVRATVLAFLAQIDADERRYMPRHQWSPSFYAGVLYDSNVNIGPSRDVIDIGGTDFSVIPASQQTSDWAGVVNAGIAHTYNPDGRFDWGETKGDFVWQSELNGYYRAYVDETGFNLGVLTARTGPAWIVPGHWRAYVAVQADQIFLGGDNLALFTSLNPGMAWQLGDDWEVGLDAFFTNRDYRSGTDEGQDGNYQSGSLTVGRYFRERSVLLQAGASYYNFDADADRFSYSGPEVFAGIVSQAWRNGAVFARAGYRWYHFDGVVPLFDRQRDDDELRLVAGFQHDYREGWLSGWSLVGSWTWTDNQSNVPIYEYYRHQVSLGLSRSF